MTQGRDRLRDVLDAVLAEDNTTLADIAGEVHLSPYHLSREFRRDARESPIGMRRRVLLERAAWQIKGGVSVTDAAFAAGYDSVEGFSRAFTRAYGVAPSRTGSSYWLPAPNGIHFHPPMSLWVRESEASMDPMTDILIRHDCDDTADLLRQVGELEDADLRKPRLGPGHQILDFDGSEDSILEVLEHLIWSKEVWLASIEGRDFPDRPDPATQRVADLIARHDRVVEAWLAAVRMIERDGRWNDRLIDALCDPPESFVISTVIAHIVTFAIHRRQLVRMMLRQAGHPIDHGDPIMWWRHQHGQN